MYTSLCGMLGFAYAIQTDTSVSEEKKEPKLIPLHDQQNDAYAMLPAQSILLPQYSQSLRETNKGSLPKPAAFRRSAQLKPEGMPLKRDPNVISGSAAPPTMNGMMSSQAGIATQPENQYLPGVPSTKNSGDDKSETSIPEQTVTTTIAQGLPVMEGVSSLPTMDGMVLPQVNSMIQPENQYFSFKLDDDDDDDSESESSANEQTVTTTTTQNLPVMEDVSALPVMDGMVLLQPDTAIQPENQYFSFKLDDDDDDDDSESESESSIHEQSMTNPPPQNLPIMEGISVLPSFNQTNIPGMGDSVLSTVLPTPSPYPTPNVPLPTVPVISASILPSTQTNSHSDTPSVNSASHSTSNTDLNASMQSTLTDLDLPYPHIADELGISYPHIADQLKESEAKPSEAPAVNNGLSFPNPPMLNHTVQPNRGTAQPGTISVILPPIATVNESQISPQDNLRIPSSSCRNAVL